MQRQHPLDSLRGVLALVVVAAHTWQIFIHPAETTGTWSALLFGVAARIAVIAFFVLSGFVIAASIASNIGRAGTFEAERFILARVFRIIPPLLAVIASTVLLSWGLDYLGASRVNFPGAARKAFTTDPVGQLWAIVSLCTQGELTGAWLNGPLWSLTFEIRMYVVAGLLAVACFGRGWLARLTACVLLWTFISRIWLDVINISSGELDLQAVSFAAFLCGALAYAFRRASALRLSIAAVLFGIAALLRISQVRGNVLVAMDTAMDTDPNLLAAQVALAGASAALIAWIARLTEWRVFRRAGEYSYTLYIGHFPFLLAVYFLFANGQPELLAWPTAVPIAISAGVAAWMLLSSFGRWIERPQGQRGAALRFVAQLAAVRRDTVAGCVAALGICIPLVSSSTPEIVDLQLFGDSTQVQAYPLIQAGFKTKVINSAKGETSSGMLVDGTDGVNLPWPRSVRARFALINHGMNDARPWARVSIEEYKRHPRQFADAPATVIFETPNPSTSDRDTAQYAQAMREVASELGVSVIDVHTCFMRQPDWKTRLYDGVHPDPEGLRYIVEECLMPSLARVVSEGVEHPSHSVDASF